MRVRVRVEREVVGVRVRVRGNRPHQRQGPDSVTDR